MYADFPYWYSKHCKAHIEPIEFLNIKKNISYVIHYHVL